MAVRRSIVIFIVGLLPALLCALSGNNVCTRTVSQLGVKKVSEIVTERSCHYVLRNGMPRNVCQTVYKIKFTVKAGIIYCLERFCCPNATEINDMCIPMTSTTTTQTTTTTTITTPTTTSPTTTTIGTTSTTTLTAILGPGNAQNQNAGSTGAAIGGVLGALIALALIAVLAFFARRRLNNNWKRETFDSEGDGGSDNPEDVSTYNGIPVKPYDVLHVYGNKEEDNLDTYDSMKSKDTIKSKDKLYDQPRVFSPNKSYHNSPQNPFYSNTKQASDGERNLQLKLENAASTGSAKNNISERIKAFERKQSANNVTENRLYYT